MDIQKESKRESERERESKHKRQIKWAASKTAGQRPITRDR